MLFTQRHLPVFALAPDADRYASDPATDVINMANYRHVTFLLIEGAGGTGTATITVEECTALDGTGATAIAFNYRLAATADTFAALTAAAAAGYLTIAGANKMVAIEIDSAELSDGSPFVRLTLTEAVASAVDACVIAIASEARYPQDTLISAIL